MKPRKVRPMTVRDEQLSACIHMIMTAGMFIIREGIHTRRD